MLSLKISLFWVFMFFCFAVCAEDETQSVLVQLKNKGDFDVFFHRSQSNATGAAIGGLIGAGIETGISKSKDMELEARLVEKLGEQNCHEQLIDSFTEKLEPADQYRLVGKDEADRNTLQLDIRIKDCGFKLVNSDSGELSAFVTLLVKLNTAKGKKLFEEKFYLRSKQQNSFDEYLNDAELTASEFQQVITKAGKRLANKLIYLK
ncbi:hypothetical protein ACFODZ_07230 [Marinicella sediminis]|uniref:Uncharacterized protein n=1 Tax=Marinicella sediminis TaxID=1792834 RepID=A0ABV7J7D1_9GAMM|nr:hypothetical protein [Marinicella sediminis]